MAQKFLEPDKKKGTVIIRRKKPARDKIIGQRTEGAVRLPPQRGLLYSPRFHSQILYSQSEAQFMANQNSSSGPKKKEVMIWLTEG